MAQCNLLLTPNQAFPMQPTVTVNPNPNIVAQSNLLLKLNRAFPMQPTANIKAGLPSA